MENTNTNNDEIFTPIINIDEGVELLSILKTVQKQDKLIGFLECLCLLREMPENTLELIDQYKIKIGIVVK